MTDLPASFYQPRVRQRASRGLRLALAAAITLLAGWQVFGLPGSFVQRLHYPEDVAGFGHGLRSVAVRSDGTWIIRRSYYVDRMSRYEISPDGALTRLQEAGTAPEASAAGELGTASVYLPSGRTLKVRPHRQVFELARQRRAEIIRQNPQLDESVRPGTYPEVTDAADPIPFVGPERPHVWIVVYGDGEENFPVLVGHHYFREIDSGAFLPPYLWLTSDRLEHLHLLHVTDETGKVEIGELASVPLSIGVFPIADTSLGLDDRRGLLYLLLPDGKRFWFDPQTLEARGQDVLPGSWEREHGQIGFGVNLRPGFPQYTVGSGWPLSQPAWERLMQALVLAFVGGLLWLLVEWRTAWKYTSAQTTAASH